MKVFLVLPLLFLLFGSSKESTLSHNRSFRGLNTTLQTNFNGTYQRKNPCTNADEEMSSYVASHEFHHHIKEDNWSDYTHKCSAIISSFLQGIGNLIRLNSKQNGTFNFHINTSISQKQDGHCLSPDKKKCNSLPTIIIEANSCELPPCKSSSDSEGPNEKVQIATHENKNLSKQDNKTPKEVMQNSAKIITKTLTTKPIEKTINVEDYSATPQCPTEDESVTYQTHIVSEELDAEGKLREGHRLTLINDEPKSQNFIPIPGYPEFSPLEKIGETKDSSAGVFNDFSQNILSTHKPKQNFEFLETSTSGRNFTTSMTIQPEDEYSTAYSDEKAATDYETSPGEINQQNTFGSENSEYLTSPMTPFTWQDFTEKSSFTTPETLNFPYYPSQTDSKFETIPESIFVNEDMNIDITPNPTFSTSGQQNEEMPEINDSLKFKNSFLSTTNQRESFPTHLNQPETSSFPSQATEFEEYDEPITKRPEAENFYPSTKQTTNFPEKTSQGSAYSDFDPEEFLKSTTPIADYPDQPHYIPKTPLPFSKVSADRPTNAEGTYPPESNQETEISYTNSYYHRPTADLFIPTEENYKLSPKRSDNSLTKQTYSQSRSGSLLDYYRENFNENINEPIANLDQQFLMTSTSSRYSSPPMTPPTASYNDPEVLTSFQSTVAPKIRFPESPTAESEAEQQSTDFRPSENPGSDYGITYIEEIIPSKYNSRSQSEFYDDLSESEFTENPPSEFFPPTTSGEYLTFPLPSQISPPPVLFSGTPDNQQSYSNQSYVYSNDFQPEPQPSVTNKTQFYMQPSQRPNSQTFSDDYVTTSPRDLFLPKPKQSNVAYTEEKPDRNVNLHYPDQVATNPVPTLYSEPITSNGYTTSSDYQESSFSKPKVQSFNDVPATKEPFLSVEKFPDSLTKYPAELRKTTPGFENDSPINLKERSSSYPDVYLTTPLLKASDTDLLEKTFDDFDFPVTNEPRKDKKISPKFSFEKSSADEPSRFTTASPSLESFTIYDSQSPDQFSTFQDVLNDDEPEPTTDEEYFIKNQSPPPSPLRNDESFTKEEPLLNVETTPNYESSTYTEQGSFDDYKEPELLLVPTSVKQNFNPQSEEFESLITPLPPITYPEYDFYSSDNPPTSQNLPVFNEPRRQIKNEAFEPITYSEASSQASAQVYENQNNESFFNSNTDYVEKYSSASSASLEKETSSFDSNSGSVVDNQSSEFITSSDEQMTDFTSDFQQPSNSYTEQYSSASSASLEKETSSFESNSESVVDNQSSEFITSSDEQMTDFTSGFQQPSNSHIRGYQSSRSQAKTDQFSPNIKVPGQQPFVGSKTTTFIEPEYQPTAKPTAESQKSWFSNFKNFDQAEITNSEDYINDFLPTVQPSKTFSNAQAQSFVRYSDVQQDSVIQSESVISNGNNQPTPTESQSEIYPQFQTNRPTDLTDLRSFTVADPTVVDIPNASPKFQSTEPPSSNTLYQKNVFNPPFSSQADLKFFNQFPSTVPPSQSIPVEDYPSSQLQSPPDYFNEEISDRHVEQSLVSLVTTSIPQLQSRERTNTKYLPTSATSYQDSTPAEESFITPPTPQTSSYSKSQKMPNYSPFALEPEPEPEPEPQPQPQPSYDKFTDIPDDNVPLLASRTFENPKITNQYSVTSSQNYLDAQEASSFRESPSSKFNAPFTAASYNPNRQLSNDLVTTPTSFSVTDVPFFQTSSGSYLKPDELITNPNERFQENIGAQEALIFADNASPQPQPDTAVKFDEETTQYQTSPGRNPQPQKTLNYANQLSDDNSDGILLEFFTNQQRSVTPESNFYSNPISSAESTTVVHNSKTRFQSKSEKTEKLSTISPRVEDLQQTEETFEQESFLTDYPVEVTPQPPNYSNSNPRESFLPYNNQLRTLPEYQKPSSREQKFLINSSTGSSQSSAEYFDDETLTPFQLQASEVNFEKEQERNSSQIRQSDEQFESFILRNESPSKVSRTPDDISKTRAPPRIRAKPHSVSENYRDDFDEYDWMTRSNERAPGRSRPPTLNSQVPSERFSYPGRNLNYNARQLLRPSPQELPLRFSRQREEEFTSGFHPSFEPRRSFSPMSQPHNFPATQTREVTTGSRASFYNPQIKLPSFASSNGPGSTTTTKVVEETITTKLPSAITESPIQEQLAYANELLNNGREIPEIQSLSSSLRGNRRFEPIEILDRPPVTDSTARSFRQHPRNNPQQVESFFEGDFSPNVSYPDYPKRRPKIDPSFPGQDYAEYHQVFPNAPLEQKFGFDEVSTQESLKMGPRHQLFDRRGTEERPYFQGRPSQHPVNYTPDREPLLFPPSQVEKEQHSNPLFHALESHMTLPLQEASPPATPNESFLHEPNHQNNFRGNSPSSHGWELPNTPPIHQQGLTKSRQPESQLVSDLTDPSNNPGEDHVSCCRHYNRVATPSPLLCPFDPILKGNMTAPSYYILISKLPLDDNGDEQFQVEKVYLGDGTPLNCILSAGKTFATSLYTPVPFSAVGKVKFRTKSDVA